MEPLTIVLLCVSIIMLGVIVWLIVKKWHGLSPEDRDILFNKGIELVRYVKTAISNDGKIDMSEWKQIYEYLITIIAYLGNKSVTAVKVQTGTEDLLLDSKTETDVSE